MSWLFGLVWRVVPQRLTLPLLVAILLGCGWMALCPKATPLDSKRLELADEVAAKLAESLPMPPAGRPTILVLPFERDSGGEVTDAVRRAIERVDRYQIPSPSIWEHVLHQAGFGSQPVPLEQAETLARGKLAADYLLAGRVESLSARTDKDEAVLEATFASIGVPPSDSDSAKDSVGRSSATATLVPSGASPLRLCAEAIHDHKSLFDMLPWSPYPWPARLIAWLLAAFLLPLATAPLLSRGLAAESNVVNLLLLLGLTALSASGAYAMVGFRINTVWTAGLSVVATALAFAYNWTLLDKLDHPA